MKQIRQVFLFLLIIGIGGCKNRPTFSKSPEITFLGIYKQIVYTDESRTTPSKDSVRISIGFKDGDGDLGSTDSENYFATVFAKQNGEFKQILLQDTVKPYTYLNKNGRFPSLNPDGRQGPLEGTLDYGASLDLRFLLRDSSQYTLKFNIYIKDNAGNASNVVETSEVTVNIY